MTEPTDPLRDRIAELLVEFDSVEPKGLAADEIMNRVVGPELDRLREELAAVTGQRDSLTGELAQAASDRNEMDRLMQLDRAQANRATAERDEARAELAKFVHESLQVDYTTTEECPEYEDDAHEQRQALANIAEMHRLLDVRQERLLAAHETLGNLRTELDDAHEKADEQADKAKWASEIAAERARLRSALAGAVVLPENWRKQVADIRVVELVQSWQDKQSECPSCGEPLRLVDHADDCPAVPAEDTPEPAAKPEPRPFTAASPVPDWPATPEPTAEAEPRPDLTGLAMEEDTVPSEGPELRGEEQ